MVAIELMKSQVERLKTGGRPNVEDWNLDRLRTGGTKPFAELAGLVRCSGYKHAPAGKWQRTHCACSALGLKQRSRTGVKEHFRNQPPKRGRITVSAPRNVVNAYGLTRLGRRHHSKDLIGWPYAAFQQRLPAMDADRYLATAAQCGQGCALRCHGKTRRGMVKEGNCVDGGLVALAGFNAQRSLAGRGTKIRGVEFLAHPIGLAQPLKSRGGEQDGFHLSFGELAQPRVHIAAELDGFNVGPQGLQLGTTPLAAGSHLGAQRQIGENAYSSQKQRRLLGRRGAESQPK